MFLILAGSLLWTMTRTAETQTRFMMREIGDLMLERGLDVVEDFFRDEEQLGKLAADLIISENVVDAPEEAKQQLKNVLSRQTNIKRLTLYYAGGREVAIDIAHPDHPETEIMLDRPQDEPFEHGYTVWSHPFYDEEMGMSLMRLTIHVSAPDVGWPVRITIDYPVGDLEALLDEIVWKDTQVPFILFEKEQVLATTAPIYDEIKPTPDEPVPSLERMIGSPLQTIWVKTEEFDQLNHNEGAHLDISEGKEYLFLYAPLRTPQALPLVVGTYMPVEEFSAPILEIEHVALGALIFMIAGTMLVAYVGHKMGSPIKNLADKAQAIRNLELDSAQHLDRSRFYEIDETNQAFNAASSALTAFSRYVPKDLVRVLLESEFSGLESTELREMTFFFSDIVGFTKVASRLSAEETTQLLNHHFEDMTKAIIASGGTVDKFIGDGVMAFWGAPEPVANHALKAFEAAKKIAEEINSQHSDASDDSTPLRIRIGLHTGVAVVGNVGSSERMNYTCIGDSVNIAARLQDLGKVVDPQAKVIVLASQNTVDALPEGHNAKFVGDIELRGRESEIGVYRLI
ncbi:adenylate/guanylate cyclase domain-containing protein [Rhodobacteraceae bacterium RKSG542]|nr:adenylate/guanylate cyclase domain-containing protein [Pseudovibrio flavus]